MQSQNSKTLVELFVPYIAPSTNSIYSGIHYRDRMKHKALAQDAVWLALNFKKATPLKVKVDLEFTPRLGKGDRMRDTSNYSYGVKLVEDGLVAAGVLQDDTQEFVGSIKMNTPLVARDKRSGIIVKITERNT